jgi:hypothetical protein
MVETSKDGSVVAGTTATPSTKQPYTSPKVKTYGDLREITTKIALLGHPDNQLQLINPLIGTGIAL